MTLVDTPGYGETLHTEESFEVICAHVDSLFERQLRAESSWTARDAERLRLQDPLVHVCLYFIAPHRLKHIDIAFMRALHRKVNIVPIIAKVRLRTGELCRRSPRVGSAPRPNRVSTTAHILD